ncbi:MAG: PIN domain-containing protein [Armatimonadetes bacterium]|nr:PIN domain-containing protein [Armatimonadota bacterium]
MRVYADTSVYSGAFEANGEEPSRNIFRLAERGRLILVISPLLRMEIAGAPPMVQDLFEDMASRAEQAQGQAEAEALMEAYLRAGIVTENHEADALHVALATVNQCDVIVSWNFRHIVNFRRIPLYNAVNVLQGYGHIAIYSPMELMEYDAQEV